MANAIYSTIFNIHSTELNFRELINIALFSEICILLICLTNMQKMLNLLTLVPNTMTQTLCRVPDTRFPVCVYTMPGKNVPAHQG